MTTSPTTPGDPRATAHQEVVPAAVVLPPATVARLARRLAASDLDAVLAPVVPVPPGWSAPALAVARARPADLQPIAPGARPRAAAVTRDGAVLRLDGDALDLGDLRAALDPGAVAAGTWTGGLVPATSDGRPRWGTAPVVLVGAGEDVEVGAADDLVHALLTLGVDARLAATTAPPPSPHHTACTFDATAVAALRPDVVITSAATSEAVEGWCTTRWTTVVEVDATLGDRCEVLPWSHRRRLRARLGPRCAPADVAVLVHRLAAGPQPELPPVPPGGGASTAPTAAPRRRPPMAVRAVTWGVPPEAPAVSTWPSIGVVVEADRTGLDGGDVLVVGSSATRHQLAEAAARAAAGAPTLAVVTVDDLDDAGSGAVALRPGAVEAVAAVGRALVPSVAARHAVRALGAAGLVVPPTPTWERIEAAEAAAAGRRADPHRVGWLLDRKGPAAASALASLGRERPEVSIELVGGDAADPAGVPVVDRRPTLDLDAAARWATVVWSPAPGRAAAGAVTSLLEVALLGVPVVAGPADAAALGALGRVVAPYDDLPALLDGPVARRRGRTLRDRAAALHGARAAAVGAHRALGWARSAGAG